MSDHPRLHVVVTDAQDRAGAAAVRCLTGAGHRVTAASLTRWGVGLWSRGCSGRRVLPDPRISLEDFVAGASALLAEERPDVLIPGRDETLLALSAHRDRLPESRSRELVDHDAVTRAFDRTRLAEAAAEVGISVPPQTLCADLAAATRAAAAYGWPVLVKPVIGCCEHDGRILREPSRWVTGPEELAAAVGRLGRCIVQQRVDGDVLSFAGVVSEQGLLGAVLSRYLRTWPVAGGHASFTVSLQPRPGLEERILSLVRRLGWTGIFELEMIERPDGTVHAIDFNPRIYGSLALAARAGVPLVSIWCERQAGRARPPARARPGVYYRFDHGEAHNLLWRLREGEYAEAAKILRPHRPSAHSLLSLRDPLPALVTVAGVAARHSPVRGRAS